MTRRAFLKAMVGLLALAVVPRSLAEPDESLATSAPELLESNDPIEADYSEFVGSLGSHGYARAQWWKRTVIVNEGWMARARVDRPKLKLTHKPRGRYRYV